jgi:tetratricopeptide (TPR) repeat protein
MSKDKISRKEMKENELEHALVGARDYVVSHEATAKKWTVLGVGAAVLVGLVWGGLALRGRRLDARLSAALGAFDAPLTTDGAGTPPGVTVYKDAAERTEAAKKLLRALADDAPGSKPGQAARTMLLALEGGATPPAKLLDGARDLAKRDPGSIVSGVAALSYLEAEAAAGRVKEAIASAKGYLDAARPPLPKDVLLFTLARLYEKDGQLADAKSSYQRLVADYPDSSMRFEAQQKVQGL